MPHQTEPKKSPDKAREGRRNPIEWLRDRSLVWWIGIVGSIGISLIAADFAVDYALAQVPLPVEVKLPQSARVYDRHGKLIATYRDEVTRFMIKLDSLPDHVSEAVIAAEDRDFYTHDGVSFTGMIRAAWENATSGRVTQGGSTITQQYVKNAVLEDPSRTIERKINEALLAIKLERRYPKEEILEMYLNTVYFGRGAYGIEAAARTYFAKHSHNLTLDESAYLAGLIPAPEKYQERAAGKERRANVLEAMNEEGYITDVELAEATDAKLKRKTAVHLRSNRQGAAYFLEWLRKEYLYPRFGDCLFRCGLRIYTTIDMDMQQAAEDSITTNLGEETDPQAALVSMTPKGEVRAMAGGRKAFDSIRAARGFNYATDSKRQAGSSFKPFTLLAAIEDGISTQSRFSGVSPKTIEDPVCTGPEGIWEPENYEGSSYGTLDLVSATANSVNTVYAELITEIGPDKVADLVEAMGFTGSDDSEEIDPVCSLSLGTLDVSPMEMARAYATFAARGVLPTVTPIRWVDNGKGKCLLGYGTPKKTDCKKVVSTEGERVVEENSVDVLTQALTSVVEAGTATSAQIGRPVAGKTGTTQDNRDAWFAGYVPQLATVVWMGYPVEDGPDKKPGTSDDVSPLMHYCGLEHCRPVHGIDVTGGSFPAAIWSGFMLAALENEEVAYFVDPIYEPTNLINPLPPPPPPEPKSEDNGRSDEEHGNSDSGNGKGKKDD